MRASGKGELGFFKGMAPDKRRQPCSHGGPQTQEYMEVLTELSRLEKVGAQSWVDVE